MKHAFKKKKIYLLIFMRLNVAAFYLSSPTADLPLYLHALIFKVIFHVNVLCCVQRKLARLMLIHS